jgi:predicted nuclease of restriction endonuclease-like RecB superfamily
VFEKAVRSTIVTNSDLFHEDKRSAVLAEAASEFGLNPDEAEDCLYGDLSENRILVRFKDSFTPEALLKRYNLALAQGLLYRALGLHIRLAGDYRIVFRHIKLAHLIHRISPHPEGGYDVRLDGPASLFRNTERYGIRMAAFLPALLLAKDWNMTADVRTRDGIKYFRLDPNCGLESHFTPLPEFDSKAEETFFGKFNRKDRDWKVEREGEVIDLGDSVMIPDFTFRHPDGRTASLEIVGFWTPEYLRQKMEKIQKAGRRNLFLAVNRTLNCGKEKFDGPVFYYRTGIKLKDVLGMLEGI